MADANNEELDMETELELEDGTVVTLGELMRQAGQARQLEGRVQDLTKFQENATRLMRGETPDAQAAFEVLKGAGFSDEEARQYAQEYVDGEEEGDSAVEPESEMSQMMRKSTRAAEERADAALRETRDMRLRMLKDAMDKNVVSAIDGNPEIVKMLETLDKTRGREHAAGAWRALQDQVREATLKNLYSRRDASGGQFSEDWVSDEAAKAAKSIAGNYRTVIGDIDALGRSPETEGELEYLKSHAPVAPPEFKKGMDKGDVEKDVRAFNVDTLSRLALDTSNGGETKV
tara:strand:- start:2575 stop:3441 length:867 start_codon:yes stop_codon:yes gene_type:complete